MRYRLIVRNLDSDDTILQQDADDVEVLRKRAIEIEDPEQEIAAKIYILDSKGWIIGGRDVDEDGWIVGATVPVHPD